MKSKFVLKSKTVQGVLGMALALLLRLLGVEIGDAETTEIVQALGVLSGAAWAVYGRMTARSGLHVTKPHYGGYTHWGLVLPFTAAIALALAASACVMQDKTPAEQAVIAAVATGDTYAALHRRYLELDQTLPSEARATLHRAAPYMDRARAWIVAGQTAVVVAELAAEPQPDAAELAAELRGLVDDLARAWPGATEAHVFSARAAVELLAQGAAALPHVVSVVAGLLGDDGAGVSSAGDLAALVLAKSDGAFASALALVAEAATVTHKE